MEGVPVEGRPRKTIRGCGLVIGVDMGYAGETGELIPKLRG